MLAGRQITGKQLILQIASGNGVLLRSPSPKIDEFAALRAKRPITDCP